MKRVRHNSESGYALLLIMAMAAIVAITLYTQVPGVSFEAQRDREQLLIDRGEQYTRAIQLFVRRFNRYPTSIDELDNTNSVRTLRAHYVDPMTGKAEWRFIHAGPGGILLDSVTTAKKTDASGTQQNFITVLEAPTTDTPGSDGGVNIASRRRPSDQPGGDVMGAAGGNVNGAGGVPGYAGPTTISADGTVVPMQPGMPPLPGIPGGVAGPQGNTPALPSQVGGPSTTAASLINQILTSPRPGGFPVNAQGNPVQNPQNPIPTIGGQPGAPTFGTSPVGTPQPQQQQQQQGAMAGGIAGVASKLAQEGIKTYNDRTAYNEWEFVYIPSKDPNAAQQGAAGGTGAQQAGQRAGQQIGRPGPVIPK